MSHEFLPFGDQALRGVMQIGKHTAEPVTLALATDMRKEELLGLEWPDINFSAGTLQVRRIHSRMMSERSVREFVEADPKTEQSRRSITLAPFALSALKHHRVG